MAFMHITTFRNGLFFWSSGVYKSFLNFLVPNSNAYFQYSLKISQTFFADTWEKKDILEVTS